jgi:hypothetical protein
MLQSAIGATYLLSSIKDRFINSIAFLKEFKNGTRRTQQEGYGVHSRKETPQWRGMRASYISAFALATHDKT